MNGVNDSCKNILNFYLISICQKTKILEILSILNEIMFEETKQKIMKGSRKSLIKEGYRRSTIKVIADCAGVNQGTG